MRRREREKEKFELNPGDRAVEWLNIATVCGIINNTSENLDEVEAKQTQHKNNGKTFEWIFPHFTSILQPSWVRFACTSIFHIFLLTPSQPAPTFMFVERSLALTLAIALSSHPNINWKYFKPHRTASSTGKEKHQETQEWTQKWKEKRREKKTHRELEND